MYGPRHGQGLGFIVSYCASPIPGSRAVGISLQSHLACHEPIATAHSKDMPKEH